MIRIKWSSQPEKEKEKVPCDNRVVIIDCGKVRERTQGFGGNSWEGGFPPFNRVFP